MVTHLSALTTFSFSSAIVLYSEKREGDRGREGEGGREREGEGGRGREGGREREGGSEGVRKEKECVEWRGECKPLSVTQAAGSVHKQVRGAVSGMYLCKGLGRPCLQQWWPPEWSRPEGGREGGRERGRERERERERGFLL